MEEYRNKPTRDDALDLMLKWQWALALFALGAWGTWQTAKRILAGEPIEPVSVGAALIFLTWFALACYIWAARLINRKASRKETPHIQVNPPAPTPDAPIESN